MGTPCDLYGDFESTFCYTNLDNCPITEFKLQIVNDEDNDPVLDAG